MQTKPLREHTSSNAAALAFGHAASTITEPRKPLIATIAPLLAVRLPRPAPHALRHAPQHQCARRTVVPKPSHDAVPADVPAAGII